MYKTFKVIDPDKTVRGALNTDIDNLFEGTDNTFEWVEFTKYYKTKTIKEQTNTKPWNDVIKKLQFKIFKDIRKAEVNMGSDMSEFYTSFKIPKRSGGFRQIDSPNEELREKLQERMKTFNKFKILNHDAAWAYTQGRDIVGAMQLHVDNHSRWYLKLDIKNFFGSCTEEFILNQLNKLYPIAGFKEHNIDLDYWMKETVHLATLKGVLPQGSPMSPMLSNLVMVEFDYVFTKVINYFQKLHNLPRLIYTRYADDIIISCKDNFNFTDLIEALEAQLKDTPLKFNKEKTRYGSSAGRNWNLGLMCNKENKLTVGHKRKNIIKQCINNFMHNRDTWSLEDCQSLLGQIAWLYKVEEDYAEGLMKYYYKKWKDNPRKELIKRIKQLNT